MDLYLPSLVSVSAATLPGEEPSRWSQVSNDLPDDSCYIPVIELLLTLQNYREHRYHPHSLSPFQDCYPHYNITLPTNKPQNKR
ncbi:hypothetical protein ONS96_011840 [Cadophora gregata f. sp. sojae]|nr:hypothetical protein ONS96_011840 [Cadophora gregata f. sp. sojae]